MPESDLSPQVQALLARAPGGGSGLSPSVQALLARAPGAAPQGPPSAPPPELTHGPREYSDEELGIANPALRFVPQPGAAGTGYTAPARSTAERLAAQRQGDPMVNDPLAQQVVAGVLGGAAGKLVGPIAAKLGPVVGGAVRGATEGATASKTSGGSALAGAAFGGALGAAGGVVTGAAARVRGRASVKDIIEGEGEGAKPSKPIRGKLAARAGEEGEHLNQVLDEDPALEHTLSTAVARHPKQALDAVQGAIERHDTLNAPVYQAITDAGGVKLTDVVNPMKKLQDGYLQAGKTAEATAVGREIESLVKNYGGDKAENAVLSGKQLQGLRNQIGQAAFEASPLASKALKTQVKRDLYGAYRDAIEGATGQLEDLAPGVNLDKFRARNKAMSVLVPMRDVLKERAASEATGAKSLVGRLHEAVPGMLAGGMLGEGVHLAGGGLKEAIAAGLATKVIPAVGRAAAQAGRHLDYGLSRITRAGAGATEAIPAAAARTAVTGASAKDSPAGRLINGVRWFGRPATAAERTAAGLPAALDHAISTNNPTLGHAALANEVLGQ